ncbi:MAG: hypothetical protein ACYSOD_00965 [Planctomycetota bacterium]
MLSKITVSPAPHISQKRSTRGVMLDVMRRDAGCDDCPGSGDGRGGLVLPASGGVGDGDLYHLMCGQ